MKDQPAFPVVQVSPSDFNNPEEINKHYGLTIRQHFAGLAMQGILAASFTGAEDVALNAIQYTDALIAELEKNRNEN